MPMPGTFKRFGRGHQTFDLADLFAYRWSPGAILPETKE